MFANVRLDRSGAAGPLARMSCAPPPVSIVRVARVGAPPPPVSTVAGWPPARRPRAMRGPH